MLRLNPKDKLLPTRCKLPKIPEDRPTQHQLHKNPRDKESNAAANLQSLDDQKERRLLPGCDLQSWTAWEEVKVLQALQGESQES